MIQQHKSGQPEPAEGANLHWAKEPDASVTKQAMFDDMLVHMADLRDQLWMGGTADRGTCEAIVALASMIGETERTLALP